MSVSQRGEHPSKAPSTAATAEVTSKVPRRSPGLAVHLLIGLFFYKGGRSGTKKKRDFPLFCASGAESCSWPAAGDALGDAPPVFYRDRAQGSPP